jgi:SAM-dependent methyltransferase
MNDFTDVNRKTLEAYDAAIAKGRNEHERVLWHDPARQYYRFQEIVAFIPDLDRPNLSILDVGAGNGEFIKFLNANGFRGLYRGIDLHAGMIAEATRRFPGISFERKDILTNPIQPVDIVVMSGIFNVDCGQTNEYVRSVVSAAYAVARERVIFNAISTYVNRRDHGHFYLDPAQAVDMAARLGDRFAIRHGFLPYNYTVCLYRGDEWQSLA